MNSPVEILELFVNLKKRMELYSQTVTETGCQAPIEQEKELFDFIDKCQAALIQCSRQLEETTVELQKNELKLAQILQSMDDFVFSLDPQHRFVSVNAPVEKLFVNKKEFIGRKVSDVLPPHINTLYIQAFEKLHTSGSAEFEYDLEMGGSLRWFHLKLTPIRKKGKFTGSVAVVREITAVKQIEKELNESKERYYSFFEQAADSIVLIDGETGDLVEFNKQTYKNLGYTQEEFKNLNISDFEVIESKEEILHHLRNIISTGVDSFETKHRTKNNEIRDIHVSAKRLSIPEKNTIHAIWRDITSFKKLEHSLRESKERYQALSEATFNSVFISENGTILDANKRSTEMFGYSINEFVGRPMASLFDSDQTSFPAHSLFTQEQIPFETIAVKKDGGKFHAEIQIKNSKYSGRPVQVTVINNIDLYKKAVNKLQRIHEDLGNLVRARTKELEKSKAELKKEIEERKKTEVTLLHRENDLEKRTLDLETMNSALKVLLDKREVDKLELENNILSNVKTLLHPYLERLKQSGLHDTQRTLVNILESNLNEIVAPFSRTISSKLLNLTPTEIQVAHLIKQGMTSKEIDKQPTPEGPVLINP